VPVDEVVMGAEREALAERLLLLVTGGVFDWLHVPENELEYLKLLEGLGVVLNVLVVVLVGSALMDRLGVGVKDPVPDQGSV